MLNNRNRSVKATWEWVSENARGGHDNLRTRDAAPWKDAHGTDVRGSLKDRVSYHGVYDSIIRAHWISLVSYIGARALRPASLTIRSPTPEVIGNDMSERER